LDATGQAWELRQAVVVLLISECALLTTLPVETRRFHGPQRLATIGLNVLLSGMLLKGFFPQQTSG
jgi:hypothetical protein